MKAASRPASGRGTHVKRSVSSRALLLIVACLLSPGRNPCSPEVSSFTAFAADSSPLTSSAAASSSSPTPFSCPPETKQLVAEACAGQLLKGEKGAPSSSFSLAGLSSVARSANQAGGARAQEDGQKNSQSVAICLIGGARNFELTGASLQRNLLQAYDNSDVFFITSPDKNSYKLSVLSMLSKSNISPQQAQGRSRFAVFNMSKQSYINVSMYPSHRLRMPHLQGQLQQFVKLEACADTISAFERATDRQYGWVLWTRLDTFWHTPLPPLTSLDPQAYYVPSAFSWGGYNDRFGMGTRNVALQAMRRLTWLQGSERFFETLLQNNDTSSSDQSSPSQAFLKTEPSVNRTELVDLVISGLNSEKLLKLQLLAQGIKPLEDPLGFCVVAFSKRRYAFASLWSSQAVNGTSCRPCAQDSDGMCSRRGAHSGWRGVFEQGAKEEERSAATYVERRGIAACRADWNAFMDMFCVASVPQHFRAC